MKDLNNIINELDIADTCRTFYPTAAESTFLSRAHGVFSRTDQSLGHKTHLNKFKRMKII